MTIVCVESHPNTLLKCKTIAPVSEGSHDVWYTIVEIPVGNTVRFKVAMESQPLTPVSVNWYDPDALWLTPLKVYELPAQILAVVVDDEVGFTVRFKVAIESQPLTPVSVTGYDPDVL